MKKASIFIAFALTLACVGIISMVTVSALNRESSEYCAVRSANSILGGNVASANGSGHHKSLTLSFGAFDHGNGNITGQATYIDEAAKTKVTIDVECINTGKNDARIGGTVQKSTDPSFAPGSGVSFIVVDNGEGASSPPDLFTPPFLGGCAGLQFGKPVLLSSDAGNIQVRFVAPDKNCEKCPEGTHCAGNGECVGGGGGGKCPDGYKECCGNCIPEFHLCEICK